MINDNDFHGSVAFGAQTVPRVCRLDESCRNNVKSSDLNKQTKLHNTDWEWNACLCVYYLQDCKQWYIVESSCLQCTLLLIFQTLRHIWQILCLLFIVLCSYLKTFLSKCVVLNFWLQSDLNTYLDTVVQPAVLIYSVLCFLNLQIMIYDVLMTIITIVHLMAFQCPFHSCVTYAYCIGRPPTRWTDDHQVRGSP